MWKLSYVIALGALAGAACRNNPYYCEGAPDNNCHVTDGPRSCGSNDECAAPTPVCDLAGSLTCVECTPEQSGTCAGTKPVCGDGGACRGCVVHAECASAACLPDGSCALESDVAYVDPAGTENTACTPATPCTEVAKALATNRPYLKLRGTTYEAVVIDQRDVTILADPGATLTHSASGAVLEIRYTSRVAIYDLEIGGATVNGSIGILMPAGGSPEVTLVRAVVRNNAGGGVVADGGTLIARRSQFLGNVGGGISLTYTQFDLENNVIARNGGPMSLFGGVLVSKIATGLRRFEFNTVTENGGMTGVTTGVLCSGVAQPIRFSNNIVYKNQALGGGQQVEGSNCTWTYSNVGPGGLGGTGNIDVDPRFENVANNDFHIGAGSLVIDRADPAATVGIDLDGEARPRGVGRDMGADERSP